LSTRKIEIRGDGGNHDENLGLQRISCGCQLTNPDIGVKSPDPEGNNTDTRSRNRIRPVVPMISHSRSYPPYCSLLHPPSLSFLSTTLQSLEEHKVKLSISISPSLYHEFTTIAVYAKCSIHRVRHTSKIVCRSFILSIAS
jgi:hypothetical protein